MHRIYGIDLGTHSVKIVAYDVGFRTSRLALTAEQPVAAGEAPLLERQAAAVKAAVGGLPAEASIYCALSGDVLSLRTMELPFTDGRKIEQVLGFELEGQIVHAIDDVVYDHSVIETRYEGTVGSTVLAAAARRDDVAALIEALRAQQLEPRAIYAAPLVYQALLPRGSGAEVAPAEAGAGAGAETATAEQPARRSQMVLDIGHQRTNVCVVRDGVAVFGRTIRRGGAHLTEALAAGFKIGLPEAEEGKRRRAFLSGAGRAAVTPVDIKLDALLREGLQPLVRELRQTLASLRAAAKEEPAVVLLAGGGARLQGLPGFLEQELGIPVMPLAVPILPDDRAAQVQPPAAEVSTWAAAAAIAAQALRNGREIDLRRGPFVYRANFSVLRQKAPRLAMAVAAVLLAAGVNAWASMSRLEREKTALDAQLKTATQELFGAPRADAKAVSQLLRKGFKEEMVPLPKATAFDLLDQISRKVPPSDKVKLDILELDIRPKKTFIKGTVDSAAAVDELATRLKEIDCYDDVAKGAVTEVSDGAKQFTLSITAKCP